MAKDTVKKTLKAIEAMYDKHQKPPEISPVDSLIEMAKKMNKGGMM